MIREFEGKEINDIMKIWLDTNISAHNFVDAEYWESNFEYAKEAILEAEIYVYDEDDEIKGFVGIVDGYIAGIFVDERYQGQSIGMKLLNYIKDIYDELTLDVFKENINAVRFYEREDFKAIEENNVEELDTLEYTMKWER